MLLLADENFPKPAVESLRAVGHDVLWARTDLPSAKDIDLLDFAESAERILMTLDKDFWQNKPLVEVFIAANTAWAGHISIITADSIQMLATHGIKH